MVINSCKTIWGLGSELNYKLNIPHTPVDNTTLNQKYDIKGTSPTGIPVMQYLTIGIGGLGVMNNIDSYTYSEHTATDAALFKDIPFVMRTEDNDIITSEKTRYAFRVVKEFNGKKYICYYLRKIDLSKVKKRYYKVTVKDGTETLSLLDTNTTEFLNTKPREPIMNITNEPVEYVAVKAQVPFLFTKEDVKELKNVFTILSPDKPVFVTEVGVCDAVPNTNGEPSNVVITHFFQMDTNTTVNMLNDNYLNRVLEIGGMQPLLRH